MPIIERVETDLFRFSNVCRHMVCPVSTEYHVTGGLIDVFIHKDPHIAEVYKTLCQDGLLQVGKPQCHRADLKSLWDTIFFPLKVYADDTAKYKDVRRCIEELRKYLLMPEHHHSVIGLPMIGCEGGGPEPYARVKDMMYLFLDSLKATVFLSMSPSKVETIPQYLVILGPKGMGKNAEEKARIDKGIDVALGKMGKSLHDFTAVIAGSETTTDKYIVGDGSESSKKHSYCGKKDVKRFFPIPINWEEDKTLALTRHRMVLTEIGTHFILIMPEGSNNNRDIYVHAYIKEANQKLATLNREEKRVVILGKSTTELKEEQPLNIDYAQE